ncbi:MAG: hypothetical protein ACXVRH_12195, partial [Thermoleophilaceae bacterium]
MSTITMKGLPLELVELPLLLELPVALPPAPPFDELDAELLDARLLPPPATKSPTPADTEATVPDTGAVSVVPETACSALATAAWALSTPAWAEAMFASFDA